MRLFNSKYGISVKRFNFVQVQYLESHNCNSIHTDRQNAKHSLTKTSIMDLLNKFV